MKTGILLLFLSDYKSKSEQVSEYEYDGTYKYSGRQTNEAPCKLLMEKSAMDGMPIKKVVCILTDEVRNIPVEGEKTAYDLFKERLVLDYKDNDLSFYPIEYSVGGTEDALSVYRGLKDILIECSGAKVYIDFTGGMRNVAFLMTSVVRYMEITDIQCGAIVYAMYRPNKKLIDITYIYEIYRLINAVDQFASSGNAEALSRFSESYKLDEAKNLMTAIIDLADDISLCQIERVEAHFRDISSALESFNSSVEQNGLFLQMLKLLIPTIKHKLYIDEQVSIPNIIRWCVDNNLLQQAVTLYVEKMPEYYFEKLILQQGDDFVTSNSGSRFYEDFYGRFYGKKDTDPYAEGFKEFLDNLPDDKIEDFSANDYMDSDYYKEYRDALVRLESVKEQHYINKEMKFMIYGERIKEKKFKGFVAAARTSNLKHLHFLLYDNEAAYNDYVKSRAKNVTYIKKFKAAEIVEHSDEVICKDGFDNKELATVMRYYLAVKIIRNNLNHASLMTDFEHKTDASMPEVIEGLKDYGIIVDMNARAIKAILLSSLDVMDKYLL